MSCDKSCGKIGCKLPCMHGYRFCEMHKCQTEKCDINIYHKGLCYKCRRTKLNQGVCLVPNCTEFEKCQIHGCQYDSCKKSTTEKFCKGHKCDKCDENGACIVHLRKMCISEGCTWNVKKGDLCYLHVCRWSGCEVKKWDQKDFCYEHTVEMGMCHFGRCQRIGCNGFCEKHRCQVCFCEKQKIYGDFCEKHLKRCKECREYVYYFTADTCLYHGNFCKKCSNEPLRGRLCCGKHVCTRFLCPREKEKGGTLCTKCKTYPNICIEEGCSKTAINGLTLCSDCSVESHRMCDYMIDCCNPMVPFKKFCEYHSCKLQGCLEGKSLLSRYFCDEHYLKK